MIDNRMQPNVNVRPEPNVNDFLEGANPEQVDQQSQQSQANAAAQRLGADRSSCPLQPYLRS